MKLIDAPHNIRKRHDTGVVSTAYRFSTVRGVRDRSPESHSLRFDELATTLRQHGERYAEKDGPAFIGAVFSPGGRRAENIQAVTWLTLDIDDAAGTVEELQGPLTNYRRIVYSTFSHGVEGKWKPGHPRFRILVPYSRAVTVEEHGAIFAHIAELLGGAPDSQAKDPGRLQYTPRKARTGAQRPAFFDAYGDLDEFNPDELPDGEGGTTSVAELVALRRSTDRREQGRRTNYRRPDRIAESWIESALLAIDPNVDYGDWRNIGTALRSEYGDEALDLFDRWSSDGDDYPGALELQRYWESWGDTPADELDEKGVTLGTVWHLACQHGWTPPESAYSATERPAAMLDPYEGVEPISLDSARATLANHVGELLDADTGRMFIVADPGVGKTTVSLDAILDAYLRGESARYLFPTNDVLEEQRDRLLKRAKGRPDVHYNALVDAITIERKRTAETCARLDVYSAAERAVEGGGAQFCESCDLHPKNMKEPSARCPFILSQYKERSSETPYILSHADEHGPKITFTTHHLETRRRGRKPDDDGERTEAIAYTQILTTLLEGGADDLFGGVNTFKPFVECTKKQWRLKAKPCDGGYQPPELLEDEDYLEEWTGEESTYQPTTQGKRTIERWLAECAAPYVSDLDADRRELFDYYRMMATERDCGLLVVDESVLSAVYGAITVTVDDLTRWAQSGDLEGPDGWLRRFVRALKEGCSNPDTIADRLPRDLEWCGNKTGEELLTGALAKTGEGAKAKALDGAPNWRALAVLERLSKTGWQGAFIYKRRDDDTGELHLPYLHPLDLDAADRVLALDATGDPVAAKAIFGPNVDYRVVKVQRPSSSKVQRVAWRLTAPAAEKDLSELDVKRHQALLSSPEFNQGAHLHITRRDLNPNVDYADRSNRVAPETKAARERHVEATEAAAAGRDTSIIHLGGTKARGSNDYEHVDSVTVASYFVPIGVIRQRAAILEAATGASTDECFQAALWQLEGAPVVQSAYRGRLLGGDTLTTYCSLVEIPGLESDRVIERDEFDSIAARETGHYTDWQTERVAADLLREFVANNGGICFAGLFSDSSSLEGVQRCTLNPHIYIYGKLGCSVAPPPENALNAIQTALKNRWDNSWSKAAKAAGLKLTRLRTDRGGEGVVILSLAPPSPGEVAELVEAAAPDWRWYELDGDRVQLVDPLDEIRAALGEIGDEWGEWNARTKRKAIGEKIGRGETTVRNRLKAAGWTVADLDEAWREANRDPLLTVYARAEEAVEWKIHTVKDGRAVHTETIYAPSFEAAYIARESGEQERFEREALTLARILRRRRGASTNRLKHFLEAASNRYRPSAPLTDEAADSMAIDLQSDLDALEELETMAREFVEELDEICAHRKRAAYTARFRDYLRRFNAHRWHQPIQFDDALVEPLTFDEWLAESEGKDRPS